MNPERMNQILIEAIGLPTDVPIEAMTLKSVSANIALTAMQRAVEEETTPKDEAEFMALMLVNITRMSDEKRSEFIKDLFVRYPELNPLRADVERLKGFAVHMSNCAWRYNGNGVCTCGLDTPANG